MATARIYDDRSASSVRVLAVEDHEPFRRFLCSMLGKRTELRVICEASDGLEAVQKAEELQPDLILFDVGLPTLNGIEAARRIRKLSPESKILFVSQESSADVVQEAFLLGAGIRSQNQCWDRTVSCRGGSFAGQAVCQCWIGGSRSRRACR
jgi:CheY-like chemotaxis protein